MDFKLIQNVEDWKVIAQQWNELLGKSRSNVPFLKYEYLAQWWETRGGGEWKDAELAIMTASEGDQMIGIAPLFFTVNGQNQPALMLLGSIEISDYLDFIILPGHEDAFVSKMIQYARSLNYPAWKQMDFYNILSSSATLPALSKAACDLGYAIQLEELQHAPFIALPDDWETYLAGIDKKQRHEIRRKLRRLEESGLKVELNVITQPEEADEATEIFLNLMDNDPAKQTFLTDAMRAQMRSVIHCAAQAGCLNLAFLEIENTKTAAYLSFDYLERLWVYNSGMDRNWNEYSPGWVLVARMIQWCIEHGYKEFDFLRGDEEYKYRFGAHDRLVMRATLTSKG
jgi:CelD/BcsL family acetyltransferase involved in cellulose biosynthesis